ncbi:MAG: class I SAM-dependent methyltransferase [Halanaeroarchaeum sp.]
MHDVPVFDRVAPVYDLVAPSTDAQPIEAGLSRVERRLETVVDLGGGTGRAARSIDLDPIVLDASQPMLARAGRHGHRTVRGDARTLPFPEDSVDAVVAVDAMHHFPDPPTVVERVYGALGTGGGFVVREFDPTTLRGLGLRVGQHLIGFDCTFYTPDDLAAVFDRVGFETTVLDRGFVYTVVGVVPGTE